MGNDMTHKVTYAALTATAVIAIVESQLQLASNLFSPAVYPIVIAIIAMLRIGVNAWRDWQSMQGHQPSAGPSDS